MFSKGFIAVLIVALGSGATPPFAKLALEEFGPMTSLMARMVLAVVITHYFLPRKELSWMMFLRLKWVALLGAFNPIFIFFALQYMPSNITPLLYAIIPSMAVAYLFFTKKVRPSVTQITGLCLGLIGVGAISFGTSGNDSENFWLGIGLAMVAVLAFFLYGIRSRAIQQKKQASSIALAFYFSIMTVIISFPLFLGEVIDKRAMLSPDIEHWGSLIMLGLVTSLAYINFQRALKILEVSYANLFLYLQPIVTITLAYLMLNENITVVAAIGGLLVLIGAQLSANQGKKL